MSRGPGQVERAIEAIFAGDGEGSFTVQRLCQIIFHGGSASSTITESQRRSVARAAAKVAKRTGWKSYVAHIGGGAAAKARGSVAPGRLGHYQHPNAHKAAMRRLSRESRGLPPDPTPEELATEEAKRALPRRRGPLSS